VSASPLEMSNPYSYQTEFEVFHTVTGTAPMSYILAKVLQELLAVGRQHLPPNLISKERDCQGPSPASTGWFSMFYYTADLGEILFLCHFKNILFIRFFSLKDTLQT